jgi:hypothetical protein
LANAARRRPWAAISTPRRRASPCGATASRAYCSGCGEARPHGRDLTLRSFLVEAFHTLTDVDGRLIRSFRALLLRPGELTVAYRDGRRKAWLGPLQIFLIANVVFFAVQGLTHDHILSGTLDSYLNTQDWKNVARSLATERVRSLETTQEEFAPRFVLAAARNARSLVGLMALPFMMLMPLLLPRRARGFVVRAAFALHLYAYLMLLFSLALIAGVADARLVIPIRPDLRSLNVAMAAAMALGEALRQTGSKT